MPTATKQLKIVEKKKKSSCCVQKCISCEPHGTVQSDQLKSKGRSEPIALKGKKILLPETVDKVE